MLMYTKPDGHLLRSELALISNMARTIKNKEEKSRMMTEYNEILMEIEKLPDVFGKVDILDDERVRLNLAAKREKLSENDHLVICISRTQGSAGMISVLNWRTILRSITMTWKSLTRL